MQRQGETKKKKIREMRSDTSRKCEPRCQKESQSHFKLVFLGQAAVAEVNSLDGKVERVYRIAHRRL